MRIESLRELLRSRPFRPFHIVLANGDRVWIPDPDWVWHRQGARTVIVVDLDESVRIIDVDLVLELKVGPPAPAGSLLGRGDAPC